MIRRAGLVLAGLGVLLLAWVGVTLQWGDPLTSLYTRHQQHELSRKLDEIDRQWAAGRIPLAPAASRAQRRPVAAELMRARAMSYRDSLLDGQPIGRLTIPRLDLRMVVVEGTSASDLEKGPGHYDAASGRTTGLPGMGGVIAIAGHRTTYLHPFLHIDDLRPGDRIELKMPYGRFTYTVYFHKVVLSTDWSILRRRPYEKLVLTACHPLHSATRRWVVFARLTHAPAV